MKNFTLSLSLMCFCLVAPFVSPAQSSGVPQPQTKVESISRLEDLTPEQRVALGRTVSVLLLHETQSRLQAFFENGDQKALAELIQPWSPEDQSTIKKELMAFTEKPSFRVENTSLIIKVGSEEAEFKVIDPFEGKFQINGHQVKIFSGLKYQAFKGKFNEGFEVSSSKNPFYDLLVPKAEAIVVQLATKLIALVRPASAAVGGIIAKEAKPVATRIAGDFSKRKVVSAAKAAAEEPSKKFLSTQTLVNAREKVVDGAIFACVAFGTDWDSSAIPGIKCVRRIQASVLCTLNIKKDKCVETVGDLAPEIKQAEGTSAPIVAVEPVNEGKCSTTAAGFSKDINIKYFDSKKVKDEVAKNPKSPPPEPSGVRSLHLEFEKNPADPKKLKPKTITEINKLSDGKIVSKRIWTFEGENWKIQDFDKSLLESQGKAQFLSYSRPPVETKCDASKLSDQCKGIYQQVIGVLGENVNCFEENASKVIENIQKDDHKANNTK